MAESNMNSILRLFPAALILLTLAGCNSSSGGGDDIISGGGSSSGGNFDLDSATLVLEGPASVAPGSADTYTATLLDEDGLPPPSPGLFVDIQPTHGSVTPEGGGNTNSDGVFQFAYTAPDVDHDLSTVLLATVTQEEATVTAELDIQIKPNIFRFFSPSPDTNVRIGEPMPLRFQWTVGGEGVNNEIVELTIDGNASGNGGFSINGGPVQDPADIAITDGDFVPTVEVVPTNRGGETRIIARSGQSEAILPLRFVGEPQSIEVSVSESSVPARGFSIITANVRDEADNNLTGIPLEFGISRCAGGGISPCGDGEEVLPVDRTTDADGNATSTYFASSDKGSAQVSVTVSDGPGDGVDGFAPLKVVNAD